MKEQVILVDERDIEIGVSEKLEAHEKGLLHRAFSVFVFNEKNELLLQQRALGKYHSPGLWTNTCCGHPRPGETIKDASVRRMKEEMGIDCPLTEHFSFRYKADFPNGLMENELDYVFYGHFDGEPCINKDEVNAWKFISVNSLLRELEYNPHDFTVWFKPALYGLIDRGIVKLA
jgi:isopentenyl-diphosphate delta-isomerase